VGVGPATNEDLSPLETAKALARAASEDEGVQYMIFARLLDFLTPPPSVVNAYFAEYYNKEPKMATDYYKNLLTDIGFMENQEKRKPKDFLKFNDEGDIVALNRRFIRMNLGGESWGFQLLPRPNEEVGIVFPEFQIPFKKAEDVFNKMFDIVEVFPHYQVRTETGFFRTNLKSTEEYTGEVIDFPSFLLVNGLINEGKLELRLTGYNKEELSDLASQFMDAKAMIATRDANAFSITVKYDKLEKLKNAVKEAQREE
jgi:UDPglucose--hexose-1-phosphate uridylyltransferase